MEATKICSKCKQEKSINQFNREAKAKCGFRSECKSCGKIYRTKYYINNSSDIILKNKLYQKLHSESIKLQKRLYKKKRRLTDATFKFKNNISHSIYQGIKNNKIPARKSQNTRELLCCDWQYVRDHLERQFKVGMTWENYGKLWHTDHIIPLDFFNLSDITEQKLANHWGNLQPMFGIENRIKSNKIPEKTNFKYFD